MKIFLYCLLFFLSFSFSSILYDDGDYWFPFPPKSMNYSNNSVLDFSHLNWKIEERIKIKDGHFYYKDKQVKFFGTNIGAKYAFPLKSESPGIAKRLAQIGFNLVRFHIFDKEIFQDNKNSIMDQEKLDKFHYLLYCLKNNGIFVNINLHVCRVYPELIGENEILEVFKYGKSLDRYYPAFINDQKNYAKDLLTSFNNYTGYKLGDDPMVLNIELNNENTIFNLEDENKVIILTDKLKAELLKQWRDYIKNKYKTYEAIDKIYNNETIDLKKNLVEGNRISCQRDNSNCTIDNTNLVKFDIISMPKTSYGNQIQYGTINISNLTSYTAEFEAKAQNPTELTMTFAFQENKSPYRGYLTVKKIPLSTEFKSYRITGRTEYNCQFTEDSKALVKIVLPQLVNHYELKNFKLYKGKYAISNFTENSEKNLDKILYPNSELIEKIPSMAYDLRLFFKDTETNTQKTLTNYIKNELKFKNIYIVDSQISYGSFFTYVRENELSDIIDMHAYWQHPSRFPGKNLGINAYSIVNTPMIKSKGFGTFNSLTKAKSYNKPLTVSEYNHPFPNEYQHEKFIMLGSWSAFHDFDAIYQFAFDPSMNEYMNGFFGMGANPIDFAMAPYITLAFRQNYVQKSKNYVKVKFTKGYIMEKMKDKNYDMNQFLSNYFYGGWNAVYEVHILDDNNFIEPVIETNINISEKGLFINDQIQWNNTNIGTDAYYYVTNEKYITLTGFLGNLKMDKINKLGNLIDIKVKLNETLNETCTIGLVSLDDKKLENSEKLLLTIVGKARNTNQTWNENRTSTLKNRWGTEPVLAQYIEMEAELKFNEKEKPKIYSINEYGELNKEFNLTGNRNKWILKSDENNPTLNYYIIRKLDKGNINLKYLTKRKFVLK